MKNEHGTIDFAKLLEDALGDKKDWTEAQWAEHDAVIEEKRRAMAPRVVRVDALEAMSLAGFPLRAIGAALDNPRDTDAMRSLKSHDFKTRPVVVLSGVPGCGKTVAATAWASTKYGARFVRASTFAASSRYDREQRNQWLNARALVIDDIGVEFNDASGSMHVDVDELIDVFYGDDRALVITTNLSSKDFGSRYGERVIDRLRECGRFIKCVGESLRKRDA